MSKHLLTLAAWAALALPAMAQENSEAAPPPTAGLEEIVVTAQRREESIQNVPVSVTAFSAADIESRGATSLLDLGMASPNVTFNTSSRGQNIRIRGVGAGDTQAIFEPGVGIYVDGLYLPRMNGMNLDLVGIERVEVLRGPQGTLFGRNTIGGAINITTSRPSETLAGSVELTLGNYDRQDLQLGLEGPIVPGVLSGSIAGLIRKREGYGVRRDFITGNRIDEGDDQDRQAVRGNLLWRVNDDLEVRLTADYSSRDEKNPIYDLIQTFPTALVTTSNALTELDYNDQFLTPDGYTNYATGPNADKLDAWSTSLILEWKLAAVTFKSLSSYLDQRHVQASDIDASPLNIFEQIVTEKSTYHSQEFQLMGLALNDRLNWIAGLYYGKERVQMNGKSYIFQTLWDAAGVDASQDLNIWTDNANAAAYGQVNHKLTDRLSVTAGLRYSYDDKEVSRQRQRLNPPFAVFVPFAAADDTWGATSGRLGLEYRWNDEVMSYVSAARGYKSGGLNGSSTSTQAFLPFDPEYLWTYEVGVRSDWLDRRLRVNASVFQTDYSDLQFFIFRTDSTGAPIQVVDNVAKAEITGFELETTALPLPGLMLTAGVGYLDGKYNSVEPGSPITLRDEFPDTPEWTLSVAGEYSHLLADGARLSGRVDYAYKTEQQRLSSNSPLAVQKGYPTLNARLAFASSSGNWEAAIFGDNLTDEEVMWWAFDARTVMNMHASYAPPRTWGVSVKYKL